MVKKIFAILAILSLSAVFGCSVTPASSTATAPASVKTVREAEIASAWAMKQMEIKLESDISIVLTLKEGDKVDGYFYLVKGDSVGFQIYGNSLIYESQPATEKSDTITSDRFSFTASLAQGLAYTLKFSINNKDGEDKTETTAFLHLMYPASGSLYVPIGTK